MNKNNTNRSAGSITDKIKAWPQYLLPHFLITDLMYFLTHSKLKVWKNMLIPWFARHYRVDMSLAVNEDLRSYENFNQFFVRPLKPEKRPICSEADSIVSPVDGTVSQAGTINTEAVFQAKGHEYSLTELLGNQQNWVDKFLNGSFATIYLSPKDYHRIHMPFDGVLRQMTYVPGRLFSVSPSTTREIPRLFARNERVVCFFDTTLGPMAVILVGAMIVGSMETVWHGIITPPHGKRLNHWYYTEDTTASSTTKTIELAKGEELGRFNMGSTVILLFPENSIQWTADTEADNSVQLGLKIATRSA